MKNRQPNFSEDLCSGGFHIEIFNDTVIIDGCKSVAEYSDGKIVLNTGFKRTSILGDELSVKSFACSQAVITGRILSVELE